MRSGGADGRGRKAGGQQASSYTCQEATDNKGVSKSQASIPRHLAAVAPGLNRPNMAGEGSATWGCGGGSAAATAAACIATCCFSAAACAARSDAWMCSRAFQSCSFSKVAVSCCKEGR